MTSKKNITIVVTSIVCILVLCFGGYLWKNLNKIEAGYVGVKVYLLGTNKGVDNEVLGPGRYYIGINEDLFLFPTFQQTVLWNGNNSFNFQTKEGMISFADVSLSYTLNRDKISKLFQTYRKGIDEISNVYMKNLIRDSINKVASTFTVEEVYGEKKQLFQDLILKDVRKKMEPIGINVDFIAFVGGIRPPKAVVDAIDAKVAATQRAQQRENELREAEAQAKKVEAIATGEANAKIQEARGRAEAIRIEAEAQADANVKLSNSINSQLIQYKTVDRWNGTLPMVSGDSTPLIDLRGITKQ